MSIRNIVVSGAFGALGSVVARAFMANGDRVVRVDSALKAPDENPVGLDFAGVDLTSPGRASAVVKEACQLLQPGGIDVLINVAGGFTWEMLREGEVATWERMHSINLLTCVALTRAVLPAMRKRPGSRVINVGAGAALQPAAGMGAYAASKAGVHALTVSLAAELADEDITVNAVLPGTIDTPANRASMPQLDPTKWVKPEALAEVFVFLASPAARAITGALIPVTRGA